MITIREIQGTELHSPYAGEVLTTQGAVTGLQRRGFFLQTEDKEWDGRGSDGVFVYSPEWKPEIGQTLMVTGAVVDFIKHDTAKPVTQLHLESAKLRKSSGIAIAAIEFTQSFLPTDYAGLARLLNSLEGMLVKIPAGQTFIAPSNTHGDYVLALDFPKSDRSELRSEHGGVIPNMNSELRWFPGFRVSNINFAQHVNLGARLRSDVVAPLNYRADSYQLALNAGFEQEPAFVGHTTTSLEPKAGSLTVLTLNCFNLDPHLESEHRVKNPRLDIDDDWEEGRFHTLAQAIVLQAKLPDIVALQEIQDNDGAEQSSVTSASKTYDLLIHAIEQLCGVKYHWADLEPEAGEDGGQPGGNIRNGFLFNPERVQLRANSLQRLGEDLECFEDSRKPLVAVFEEITNQKPLAVINIHLASKRHQQSIFAPESPGVDGKREIRDQQASVVYACTRDLAEQGIPFYVTGDFNDTEHSSTLAIICGEENRNLVMDLTPSERYDYNHRGKLQVLMHGVVSKQMHEDQAAEYEILHGNELRGVVPGEESDKPSDHAYVIARLSLR